METERLYLRERTKQLLNEIMILPTEDQLHLLGHDSIEQLHLDLERSRKRFKNHETKWIKWDLIQKSSQQVIGSCSFHNWYEEHERAELGYQLNNNYQGKGFMLEALTQVMAYGFVHLKLNRVEALISPSNTKSINVAERLHFRKEGILREHYKTNNIIDDSIMYALLKSEYKQVTGN